MIFRILAATCSVTFLFSLFAQGADIRSVYRNLAKEYTLIPLDVDEDGDLDVLAATTQAFTSSASIAVFYQESDGTFDGPHVLSYHAGIPGTIMAFGKRNAGNKQTAFRLETLPDPSINFQYKQEYVLYPFWGKKSISTGNIAIELESDTSSPGGDDIDDDGYVDFIIEKTNESLSASWGNNSAPSLILSLSTDSTYSKFIDILDIDNNGKKDFIYEGQLNSQNGICVSRQIPNRKFSPPALLRFQDNTVIPRDQWQFADLNGDNYIDLFAFKYNSSTQKNQLIYSLHSPTGYTSSVALNIDIPFGTLVGVDSKPGEKARFYGINLPQGSAAFLTSFLYDDPSGLTKTNLEDLTNSNDKLLRHNPVTQLLHDINEDGFQDILLSLVWKHPDPAQQQGLNGLQQLCIGFGQADGSFNFIWQGIPPLSGSIEETGDFNNDGYPDYIVGHTPENDVCLILNEQGKYWNRSRTLRELLPTAWKKQGLRITSIAAADLNEDGSPDLSVHLQLKLPSSGSVISKYSNYCIIALNDGTGQFAYQHDLPEEFLNGMVQHDCNIFDFADWDDDGDLDAIAYGYGWYENQNGLLSTQLNFLIAPGTTTDVLGNPIQIAAEGIVTDVNGDNKLDFVNLFANEIGNPSSTNPNGVYYRVTILLGNGSGGIEQIIHLPVSLITTDVLGNPLLMKAVFFDLNEDGKKDFIFQRALSDALGNPAIQYWIAYNTEDGKFSSFTPINAVGGIYGITLTDYNGDGTIDLASPSGYTEGSIFGPRKSPRYTFFDRFVQTEATDMIDFDADFDSDISFRAKLLYQEGLYTMINPIVDSTDPIVRYALDAGLRAENALPSSDPEKDGINNLTEFLFGGNPSGSDNTAILPRLGTRLEQSQPRLTAQFRMRKAIPSGRKYKLLISHDLLTWLNVPFEDGITSDIDSTWQNIRFDIDPAILLPDDRRAFIMWDVE